MNVTIKKHPKQCDVHSVWDTWILGPKLSKWYQPEFTLRVNPRQKCCTLRCQFETPNPQIPESVPFLQPMFKRFSDLAGNHYYLIVLDIKVHKEKLIKNPNQIHFERFFIHHTHLINSRSKEGENKRSRLTYYVRSFTPNKLSVVTFSVQKMKNEKE